MGSPLTAGRVSTYGPRVIAREQDGNFVLMHVPDDRYLILDESGRNLWQLIEAGTTDISQLIDAFTRTSGANRDIASYQVLTFLDELRAQDMLELEMDMTSSTPGLDEPLPEDAILTSVVQAKIPNTNLRRILSLRRLSPGTSLVEIREITRQATGRRIEPVSRLIIARSDKANLSGTELASLLEGRDDDSDVERISLIDNPQPELQLSEVLRSQDAGGSLPPGAIARLGANRPAPAVVIVIVNGGSGTIIVIVVGPVGPSRGKSRSACKTMCV